MDLVPPAGLTSSLSPERFYSSSFAITRSATGTAMLTVRWSEWPLGRTVTALPVKRRLQSPKRCEVVGAVTETSSVGEGADAATTFIVRRRCRYMCRPLVSSSVLVTRSTKPWRSPVCCVTAMASSRQVHCHGWPFASQIKRWAVTATRVPTGRSVSSIATSTSVSQATVKSNTSQVHALPRSAGRVRSLDRFLPMVVAEALSRRTDQER